MTEAKTTHSALHIEPMKSIQIEITTRCNLDCFYCAGRLYDNQRDMPFDMFAEILDSHVLKYGRPSRAILQGEGEPTLHPDLYKMSRYARQKYRLMTQITTNGLYGDNDGLAEHFDSIYLSIETLDKEESKSVGRLNLQKTLNTLEYLRTKKILLGVHTVRMEGINEDRALDKYLAEKRITQHVIRLIKKQEYIKVYKNRVPFEISKEVKPFDCMILRTKSRYYYTVDGTILPCCYIKDNTIFPGMQAMEEALENNQQPSCCNGCAYANTASIPDIT